MEPVTPVLRKFRLVKSLEQSVLQLQRARDRLQSENQKMRAEMAEWTRFCPHGHFYSPLPSRDGVTAAFARGGYGPPFPAVALNGDTPFALLKEFATYYPDLPFPENETAGRRFHLANPAYGHDDAVVLYGMMRRLQEKSKKLNCPHGGQGEFYGSNRSGALSCHHHA